MEQFVVLIAGGIMLHLVNPNCHILKSFQILRMVSLLKIPFARVFAALDSDCFKACFISWVQSLQHHVPGVIAIDGKTLKRSFDKANAQSAIHMVSAFASETGLVLGQQKINQKSNEITAIPKLLKLLELNGCIVSIDAMGCQTKIARQTRNQGADYVLRAYAPVTINDLSSLDR